ncbi:hypothetical protein [Streptomyces griseoluteus]|uniref:hypothetical protein n=1 Tax=Streptomyces griseoluteus TaxID=29306 RepID=UPI0036FCDA69
MTRYRPRRLLLAGTLAVPVPAGVLYGVMFLAGATVEIFGVSWMTAVSPRTPTGDQSVRAGQESQSE